VADGADFLLRTTHQMLEFFWLLWDNLSTLEEKVFDYLWKSPAPSKLVAFYWTLLLNRMPTRKNLAVRNALGWMRGRRVYCVKVWERQLVSS